MRKFVLFFICVAVVSSCHEPKDQAPLNSSSVFRKEIGEKIPLDVAERWIERLTARNSSGRIQTHRQVNVAILRDFLNPLNDKVGVGFHHAIDQNWKHRILIVPYHENVSLWDSKVLDSETGDIIDNALAREWADNYKAQNPAGMWSFFFGRNVIDTIVNAPDFNRLELVSGENDLNAEQLMLYVWYSHSMVSGRNLNENIEVYDASLGCPAACPN